MPGFDWIWPLKCPIWIDMTDFDSNMTGFKWSGLQQPGCILCQKSGHISFRLSHFFDLFWNVTMIMNTCFIDNFAARVLILHSVLHKKIFWGPQKSKRSKNLSKTLAYSGRFWLTLADSGQLWLTFEDSCWLWLTMSDLGWLCLTLTDPGGLWLTQADS